MKQFYDSTFIVNAGIDDEQIEHTIRLVEETITKNGGEIITLDRIGRRRLAFPIAKKHNGFYVAIEFMAEGKIIDKVERVYQLDENILRYLTIKLNKRQLEAKRQREVLAKQLLEEREEETAIPEPAPVPIP